MDFLNTEKALHIVSNQKALQLPTVDLEKEIGNLIKYYGL